jgi:hypothetical protein
MRPSFLRSGILAALTFAANVAFAQAYSPPRTSFGAPSFEGVWTNVSLTTLERTDAFKSLVVPDAEAKAFEAAHPRRPPIPNDRLGQGDSEWWEYTAGLARIDGKARSSWIVDPPDGRLPFSAEGRKKLKLTVGADDPEERTLGDRCLSDKAGPPMLNGNYNNHWRIVQTKEFLLVQMEHNTDLRVIRIGAEHLPSAIRQWKGDSIARWEGDTLVVETVNLHARQSWRRQSLWHYYLSADAVVTERFTRVGEGEILYEFAVDDPATYTSVWRGQMPLRATANRMFEYACHEGNYSLANILAGGRRGR